MSVSGVTQMDNFIPEIWSSLIYDELRKKIVFSDIFFRDYEGEIKAKGDKVRVNTIVAPNAEDIADNQQFTPSPLASSQIEVVADTISLASFEFTSLAQLQSLEFQAEASKALAYSVRKKMEQNIINALAAGVSTSGPDHDIAPASASDLAAVDLVTIRTLLSTQSVPMDGGLYFVGAPSYYGDLLTKQIISSQDYVQESPTVTGKISQTRYGMGILESDLLAADVGYGCHRTALHIVMQKDMEVKVSDLHADRKLGFLMSAHIVYGIKVMDNKRYVKISG